MRDKQQSFHAFALDVSLRHAEHYRRNPLPADEEREMQALAAKSLEEQAAIERNETESFDAFVAAYRDYKLTRADA
jgi:glutamate--cysteine ligase